MQETPPFVVEVDPHWGLVHVVVLIAAAVVFVGSVWLLARLGRRVKNR